VLVCCVTCATGLTLGQPDNTWENDLMVGQPVITCGTNLTEGQLGPVLVVRTSDLALLIGIPMVVKKKSRDIVKMRVRKKLYTKGK
jgi:hypothetical protein